MNLRDVTSLRYSSLEFGFPGRPGRALEIHTTQRIWLISCNDGDVIFDTWVTHISKAANKKPKRTSIQQESKSGKKKTMPRRPSFEEETKMNHLKKQFNTSSNSINISQDDNEKAENQNESTRNTIKTKLSQKLCGPSYNLHSSSFSSEYSMELMEEEHGESPTPSYNCYLPEVDAEDGNKNYNDKNNKNDKKENSHCTTERIEGEYF